MIIRPTEPADIPVAAAVAAASYATAFADILEAETIAPYDTAFFTTRFTAARDRLRVAEHDGAIVGFCLMTDGHIDMIFVAPAALGTGAGHALFADAEARARGVVGDHGKAAGATLDERIDHALRRADAHEAADHHAGVIRDECRGGGGLDGVAHDQATGGAIGVQAGFRCKQGASGGGIWTVRAENAGIGVPF